MLALTPEERAAAAGERGRGAAIAMRIVAEAARLMGAPRLIPVASAHIDGALYHGDSGTLFAEALVDGRARVPITSTLNVGALDLVGCSRVRLPPHEREMARRMMRAYEAMGCAPTWTCAPYQAATGPRRAATSPGANRTRWCSATPCSAPAPTGMATSSTSPARSRAARRTMGCIAPKTAAPRWWSTPPASPRRCAARTCSGPCSARGWA